jgi:F-type H+-transporting ATPase subunit b
MNQIANQLGQLLVQSIPTIVFVLFLLAFLNRLLFKPLSQILDARASATSGALAEARKQADRADERVREYEQSIQAARQEIYRHREQVRRTALGERDSKVHEARGRAESIVKDAQADLDRQALAAKAELRIAVDSLATEVTASLFAPRLPGGGHGDVRA